MRIRSINAQLSLLTTLTIAVVITGFIVYVSYSSRQGMLESQLANMKQLNMNLNKATADILDESISTARGLAAQRAIYNVLTGKEQPPIAQNRIEVYLGNSPALNAIRLVNLEGQILADAGRGGVNLVGKPLDQKDSMNAIRKDQVFIDPTARREGDSGKIVVSMVAPVHDATGKLVGGIVADFDWSRFSDRYINSTSVGESGYPMIIDHMGRVISHRSAKLLLSDVSKFDFIKKVMTAESGTTSYNWEGRDKLMAWDVFKATGWRIITTAYEDDLAAVAKTQRNILIVAGVLAILLLITVIVVMLRTMIFAPMNNIRDFAGQIAQGKLNAQLKGRFKYELAELSSDLQIMVNELKEKLGFAEGVLRGMPLPCMVVDANESISYINQFYLDLFQKPGKTDDYINLTLSRVFYGEDGRQTIAGKAMRDRSNVRNKEMTVETGKGKSIVLRYDVAPLYDFSGSLLGAFLCFVDLTEIRQQQRKIEAQNERIAQAAREANTISEQVASATQELSAQIDQSSSGAEDQGRRVGEAATAMEEMNASVLEVARNASNAAEAADKAKGKAMEGDAIVENVVASIQQVNEKSMEMKTSLDQLGQQAHGIGQIMTVISDIADQTNLLALNAAIEAARAGDAGRGFAVVADEVRKLAEKTMNATKEVASAVEAIQAGTRVNIQNMDEAATAVGESTNLANQAGEALREILGIVESTADQVRNIATASEQQSAASEEINRGIEKINNIAMETAGGMRESARAVAELAQMSQQLKGVMDELIRN